MKQGTHSWLEAVKSRIHWGSQTATRVWNKEVWDTGQSLPSVSSATKLPGDLKTEDTEEIKN